jgi:hypothetical protein
MKTLAPALAKLEKSVRIHHNLQAGFGQLYNFTSDEKWHPTPATRQTRRTG